MAHVFQRTEVVWTLAHLFRELKVLDLGSCFRGPRIFRSWIMFFRGPRVFWELANVFREPKVLNPGSCF